MRKVLCVLLAGLIMLLSSGCRFFGNDFSSLLAAPKSPGDLSGIQNALVESINGEYDLQYPVEGEHRTAMVQFDLNRDGIDEAFAFYSTNNDDGTTTMHLSFIKRTDKIWSVKSDLQMVASGINFIDFHDMDADGVYEVVAGWKGYNSISSILTIYCYENDGLIQRIKDDYLAYLLYDADDDKQSELFVVNGQRTVLTGNAEAEPEKTVVAASLYKLQKNEIVEIGRCGLDATVEKYDIPKYANITKDKKAVIMDGYVTNGGMITEAFVWEKGILSGMFYDAVTGQNNMTFRVSSIKSMDYDDDGIIEIPQMQQLPTPSGQSGESVYLTKWMQVSANGFESRGSSIVNTVDGYMIDIPKKWDKNITIVRKMDSKQRIIYMWDNKNFLLSDEIFRVQLFTIEDWESNKNNENWVELKRDETYVYAGIVNEKAEWSISIKELKNGLRLLSPNEEE